MNIKANQIQIKTFINEDKLNKWLSSQSDEIKIFDIQFQNSQDAFLWSVVFSGKPSIPGTLKDGR